MLRAEQTLVGRFLRVDGHQLAADVRKQIGQHPDAFQLDGKEINSQIFLRNLLKQETNLLTLLQPVEQFQTRRNVRRQLPVIPSQILVREPIITWFEVVDYPPDEPRTRLIVQLAAQAVRPEDRDDNVPVPHVGVLVTEHVRVLDEPLVLVDVVEKLHETGPLQAGPFRTVIGLRTRCRGHAKLVHGGFGSKSTGEDVTQTSASASAATGTAGGSHRIVANAFQPEAGTALQGCIFGSR